MPSLFHSNNIPQLQERINQINREIDSLMQFRTKCENRIQHLRNRGFLATLSPEQKKAALEYCGDDTIGHRGPIEDKEEK